MEVQWPLVLFTLFIAIGAGTFGVAGLLAGLKKGLKIQFAATIFALLAIIIGGVASVTHLQHWDRAFNGFSNLSSGITQELISLAILVVFAIVYLVLSKRGDIPAWAGWVAALLSVIAIIVMSNSYNMSSRPVWNSPLLWLYYLSNAILFGGFICAILLGIKKEEAKTSVWAALTGGLLSVVALIGYLFFIPAQAANLTAVGFYHDPTNPTKAISDPSAILSSFATGSEAMLFWGGALVLGALVPVLAAFLSKKKDGSALIGLAAVGALCGIAGAICFRVVLYALGFSVFVFY